MYACVCILCLFGMLIFYYHSNGGLRIVETEKKTHRECLVKHKDNSSSFSSSFPLKIKKETCSLVFFFFFFFFF
ncbi:hypothetical protein F4809DRAFT_623868, partial [Biscogniauxia mediterranea]